MDIAAHPLIGPSISYAKEEILADIAQDRIPKSKTWYAITSAYEEKNLFYILSAREFRNPMYHIPEKKLKLFGIAGTKEEAKDIVVIILQQTGNTNSLAEIKLSLENF